MDERELREDIEELVGKEESGDVVRTVDGWGWESNEVKEVWKGERWSELFALYWVEAVKGDWA